MLEWLKSILGENYTEEIDKKVSAEIGKGFVARSDFNILNETKKTLETQLSERDGQLEELKKVDTKGLQEEITRLQGENTAAKAKYESDLAAVKLDAALDAAITAAGGKNAKAVKALLNRDKLKLAEDGTVEGLDLESVKASDGYLFTVTETKQQGDSSGGGDIGNGGNSDEPPEDYGAYKAWREKH